MVQLEICYPDDRRVVVEVTEPEAIIGRDASCDVSLDDTITSRRHARLYRDASGQYWLEDLQSKNGTLVNEQRITTARIRSGDQIGIGACRLTLTSEDGPVVVLSDIGTQVPYASTSAWKADQRLDLPQQRLEKLYELNERLTGLFDRDELLNVVLDICAELLRFERVGIAVWPGEGREPQWIKLKDVRDGASGEFRISRSLVDRALHEGERILITDTADVDPTASMISNNIRSAMCVPMEYLQSVQGVIYGDRVTSTGGYIKEDIDFFAALGRLGAMGLANVRLVEEMRHRQQVDAQLLLARQIQSQLFPSEPLVRPGLTIDALNDPGQKISGDYCDYYVRDDGLIVVLIADVVGKGVPASLLMANLQAAVHVTLPPGGESVSGQGDRPGESEAPRAPSEPSEPGYSAEADLSRAVAAMNRLTCRNVAELRFITAFFGLLDPAAKTLTYINAGHPWPFLLHPEGRVEETTAESGLPLGIEPDFQYQPGVIDLKDTPLTLFFYTDGVPEAENEQGDFFEDSRLIKTLEANTDQPPGELLTRIRRSIKQFTRNHPQSDDITMVAVQLE